MAVPAFIIVETGSGIANANAYVSITDVNAHHESRGNTKWATYSDVQKATAIIRATDYIDKRFARRFRGARTISFQPLAWPRLNAFDDDGFVLGGDGHLPKQLVKAASEYALRAAIHMVLAPDPLQNVPPGDFTSQATAVDQDSEISGFVTKKSVKVGPVEQSISYETSAQRLAGKSGTRAEQSVMVDDTSIPEYPEADMWIEVLLNTSTIAKTLVRGD